MPVNPILRSMVVLGQEAGNAKARNDMMALQKLTAAVEALAGVSGAQQAQAQTGLLGEQAERIRTLKPGEVKEQEGAAKERAARTEGIEATTGEQALRNQILKSAIDMGLINAQNAQAFAEAVLGKAKAERGGEKAKLFEKTQVEVPGVGMTSADIAADFLDVMQKREGVLSTQTTNTINQAVAKHAERIQSLTASQLQLSVDTLAADYRGKLQAGYFTQTPQIDMDRALQEVNNLALQGKTAEAQTKLLDVQLKYADETAREQLNQIKEDIKYRQETIGIQRRQVGVEEGRLALMTKEQEENVRLTLMRLELDTQELLAKATPGTNLEAIIDVHRKDIPTAIAQITETPDQSKQEAGIALTESINLTLESLGASHRIIIDKSGQVRTISAAGYQSVLSEYQKGITIQQLEKKFPSAGWGVSVGVMQAPGVSGVGAPNFITMNRPFVDVNEFNRVTSSPQAANDYLTAVGRGNLGAGVNAIAQLGAALEQSDPKKFQQAQKILDLASEYQPPQPPGAGQSQPPGATQPATQPTTQPTQEAKPRQPRLRRRLWPG